MESFAGKVRDEVLAVEAFGSLLEAKIVIEDWRTTYNSIRPHSSLGWKTPAAYAASLTPEAKETTPDSHSGWTDKRGAVTLPPDETRLLRAPSPAGRHYT